MPEYYFLPKRVVRAAPWLKGVAQRVEGAVIAGFFAALGRMSLARASRVAFWMFANLGMLTARRNKMIANLAVAFPNAGAPELRGLARGCFGHFGMAFAEMCHLEEIWRERGERLEFVVDPAIRVVSPGAGPAVFVTAHVGAWQLTNFVGAQYDLPITIIYAPESNASVDKIVRGLRDALPIRTVARDNSMRELLRELGAGRSVGLAGDTRLDEGADIPFFGVAAPTNTVAARLALHNDCELVAVLAERLPGNRFRITLHGPVEPDDRAATTAEQARQMTVKLNLLFEGWIREAPDQWACFARRWPREAERQALRGRALAG